MAESTDLPQGPEASEELTQEEPQMVRVDRAQFDALVGGYLTMKTDFKQFILDVIEVQQAGQDISPLKMLKMATSGKPPEFLVRFHHQLQDVAQKHFPELIQDTPQ